MKNTHKLQLLNYLLKNNFSSFLHKSFNTINPGISYINNWHLIVISDYLEQVKNGSIKKLIINMPPRALKSVCVSVAFPAWLLSHNPALRIIAASYSQTLSIKHSLDCKLIILSDWYKKLFPKTILSNKHNQKSKFLTTQNGFRFATSIGGSVTGEGGDVLIIDDPHNPTYIHSKKIRHKVIDWYEQTFASRLNDQNNGKIILVMQRLHEEDLAGHLLKKSSSDWHLLKIPAIADRDYIFNNYIFKEGEILYTHLTEYFSHLSSEIGIENFSAQYLQKPLTNNKSFLNFKDLTFYEKEAEYSFIIQSWDTAIKITENCDYSVCTTWGIASCGYYLLDLFRQKITYNELKQAVKILAEKYTPQFILIEDKASGQNLIQDAKRETNCNIIGITPRGDKITRFICQTPDFYQKRVLLPQNKYPELIEEITNFPNSKHDDIIDSISQFLQYIKTFTNKEVRIRNI